MAHHRSRTARIRSRHLRRRHRRPGRPAPELRPGHPQHRRSGGPGRFVGHRPLRCGGAPSRRLRGLAPRDRPGGRDRPHDERITLGTAVTVLSSDDPVRVYERFATLDAVSNGRAEITSDGVRSPSRSRCSATTCRTTSALFEEKVDLFAQLLTEKPVTWEGSLRAPLTDASVFPKTAHGLTAWVGVGGTPESVVRAARLRLRPDARHHRRPRRPVPAVRPALPAALEDFERPEATAGRRPLARPRGRVRQAGGPELWLLRASRGDEPDRPGARLAALGPRARFERRHAATGRLHVGSPETVARKMAGRSGDLGRPAFRPEVLQRHPAARPPHARHPPVRHAGAPRVREHARRRTAAAGAASVA